jgi:hypothetical protein
MIDERALQRQVAQALGVDADSVDVERKRSAVIAVDFAVMNASHLYADEAAVARQLGADPALRSTLTKLLRVHRGKNFSFVLQDVHVPDSAWSHLQASELLEMIDRALAAVARRCVEREQAASGVNDSRAAAGSGAPLETELFTLFAEEVAPAYVREMRAELEAAIADVTDLRVELQGDRRTNNAAALERELAEEIAARREAERKYREAVEHEGHLRDDIKRLERDAQHARPEVRRLREELAALEASNERLVAQRNDRQRSLDDLRSDTTASLDQLTRDLASAEEELALWRRRCTELERERDASQRSYQTSEEAMKLSLARAERRLFEATRGAHVAAGAAELLREDGSPRRRGTLRADAQVSSLASDAVGRSTKRAPDEPTYKARESAGQNVADLRDRLRRTESELRTRTLQLGEALRKGE